VRLNQRTATIHCDGRVWRAGFGLLQHVADIAINRPDVNDGLERTIAVESAKPTINPAAVAKIFTV